MNVTDRNTLRLIVPPLLALGLVAIISRPLDAPAPLAPVLPESSSAQHMSPAPPSLP